MEALELEGPEAAFAVLSQIAFALHSHDPSLRQIVVPAQVKEEARSQVARATEGTIVLDDRGTVVGFNEAAERIFGFPAKEVIQGDVSLLFASDDPSEPAFTIHPAPSGAGLTLTPSPGLCGRRRGGGTVPLDVRIGEMAIDGRQRFVLSVQDLLEKRLLEEPTRRAEARYRALVEQIPAVTFMAALDEGMSEMYVSPQIEALLGFSQKEWLDDPILWFKQLHPDDQDLWTREFSRGIASGGPFRAECRVLTRDRRVVWILGEARLVRDDAGHPLFLQGIAFDITESKRAEQQMRDAQETKIRTERLAAVGRLAASIGHDIRNPLGAIGNAFYYVKKRLSGTGLGEDARVAQVLGVIENELGTINRIVTDLLDYARERRPQLVACPLAPLVADAISVVPAPAHVTIDNQVSDTLPVPDLDKDQFRQVIVNLVQNAAEAIPEGRQGRVVVTATVSDEEIRIAIADNGAGIPEEQLDKIFEPLYTSKVKGTGLGLSIVSNAVNRHGGTLEVQSRRNVGTTFTVRLPRQRGAAARRP